MVTKALFCGTDCEQAPLVRSFGQCPECGEIYGETKENRGRYRNNAWLICKICSWDLTRCARCGKVVPNVKESDRQDALRGSSLRESIAGPEAASNRRDRRRYGRLE